MSDILIRNVRPELKREIEELARAHKRSLSREIEALARAGVGQSKRCDRAEASGPNLAQLFPKEYRIGDFIRRAMTRNARRRDSVAE